MYIDVAKFVDMLNDSASLFLHTLKYFANIGWFVHFIYSRIVRTIIHLSQLKNEYSMVK